MNRLVSIARAVIFGLVVTVLASAPSCENVGESTPLDTQASSTEIQRFIDMAQVADCANTWNRLYAIDDTLVFWDRAGRCADNSYARVLYSQDPDHVVCRLSDSIAGPRRECVDVRFGAMFDVIVENRNKPDLGLGSSHRVKRVDF